VSRPTTVATLIGMRTTRKGTWLGIPHDRRRPTRERATALVPKVMGWGYGLNLAEVARRLRLVR